MKSIFGIARRILFHDVGDFGLTLCLRLSALLCFAGWTWVHFYWEGSYGVLLWQDSTYEFAKRWGMNWDDFVGTGADDGLVQRWMSRLAWLYLVCLIVTFTIRPQAWRQMATLVAGSGLLAFLSYAKYVSADHQLPMFVEHGGQMLSPVLLVMALALGPRHSVTILTAIVAVITTFAGHGSYALGLWPTPSNYHAMTMLILGWEHESTIQFLRVAGVLDFIVCVGLLIPRARAWSALYATAWGLLTALARPVAGMSSELNFWGADQFLHEAILRAPHALVPFYLYLLWRRHHP